MFVSVPAAAIELIESPLQFLTKAVGKTVKYDDDLIQLLILAGLSAYTPVPINIGIEAPPSEGKTFTAIETLKIFPREDVIVLGDLSPKALIHEKAVRVDDKMQPVEGKINELNNQLEETEDKEEKKKIKNQINKIYTESNYLVDLSKKIMLFMESPRYQTWEMLRPILSHDTWTATYKITEQVRGRHVTKTVFLQGWPSVIYTKAENDADEIWEQIKSRFLIVSPQMHSEKYKAGMVVTGERRLIPKSPQKLKQLDTPIKRSKQYIILLKNLIKTLTYPYQDMIKQDPELIKDITIFWCPFQEQLINVFPHDKGQNMRDFNSFSSLMEMYALANYFKRPQIESSEGTRYIMVTVGDYLAAKEIFERGTVKYRTGQQFIDFYEKVILPLWRRRTDPEGFLVKDVAEYSSQNFRHLTEQTIRENYLKPLKDFGFVTIVSAEYGGYKWAPTGKDVNSFFQDELEYSPDCHEKALEQLKGHLIIKRVQAYDVEKIRKELVKVDDSSKALKVYNAILKREGEFETEIGGEDTYKYFEI